MLSLPVAEAEATLSCVFDTVGVARICRLLNCAFTPPALTAKEPAMDAAVSADGEAFVGMLQDVGFVTEANPVAVHIVCVTMLARAAHAKINKPSPMFLIESYYIQRDNLVNAFPYNSGMISSGFGALRLNRREWTKRIAGALAAAPALAQATQKIPPQGAPATPNPLATPEQRLQKAYADVHAISDKLSKLEVPMNVEPAFAFRA